MQLRTARLCLDCDEVHDTQQCPPCASETFAFITRWVPVPDRADRPRSRARALEPSSPEALGAYREMLHPEPPGGNGARFAVARWVWRSSASPDGSGGRTLSRAPTARRPPTTRRRPSAQVTPNGDVDHLARQRRAHRAPRLGPCDPAATRASAHRRRRLRSQRLSRDTRTGRHRASITPCTRCSR